MERRHGKGLTTVELASWLLAVVRSGSRELMSELDVDISAGLNRDRRIPVSFYLYTSQTSQDTVSGCRQVLTHVVGTSYSGAEKLSTLIGQYQLEFERNISIFDSLKKKGIRRVTVFNILTFENIFLKPV